MRTILITLLILFAYIAVHSQPPYWHYTIIKKKNDFRFPVLQPEKGNPAAEKINLHLQLSELELLKGFEKDNLFEKVAINNGTVYGGKVDISFAIHQNTKRLLSIKFNESSCGMTCAYWVRYYNFNSGNGDLIRLEDLFTKQGFQHLKRYIAEKRTRAMKVQFAQLGAAAREDLADVIDCFKDNDLWDFYVQGNAIIIDGENCFSKNQKGYDVDREVKLTLSEFQNYLNDYGKSLFLVSSEDIKKFRSNTLPQLFTGTIGNAPFWLIIRQYKDHSVDGIYAYKKYGRGISLEGEQKGSRLHLNEQTDRPDGSEVMDAQLRGKTIVGTWANQGKTKMLPLQAHRK